MYQAIGIVELKSIAKGIEATDAALKSAGVKLVSAHPSCPGKYEIILTGGIADVKMVNPGEDILVISDDGTIIRMAVDHISVLGRSTQGVRIMRLAEGSRVISIERTEREQGEDEAEETEAEEAPEGSGEE